MWLLSLGESNNCTSIFYFHVFIYLVSFLLSFENWIISYGWNQVKSLTCWMSSINVVISNPLLSIFVERITHTSKKFLAKCCWTFCNHLLTVFWSFSSGHEGLIQTLSWDGTGSRLLSTDLVGVCKLWTMKAGSYWVV